MKVIIAAGGTGGHIYPGITVAQTLVERDPKVDVLFVGNADGLESELVPKAGFQFKAVAARHLQRRVSLSVLRTGWTAFRGLQQSGRIIRQFRPDVALGTGGYVSGPVMAAAALQRVPTVIQEQNAYPGLTSRVLGRFVHTVALGNDAAAAHFRRSKHVEVTGNPIRRDIITKTRSDGYKRFGLKPGLKTVLVFGGSQGGASLNKAMERATSVLLDADDVQIIWQTGTAGFATVADRLRALPGTEIDAQHLRSGHLHVLPFIDDMAAAYAAADVVVCRAGAITLAELAARGLPSVLVPYPHAAEGHQMANARVLERAGAAVVIADENLTSSTLTDVVRSLLADAKKLEQMAAASGRLGRRDAAERIAALVRAAAQRAG